MSDLGNQVNMYICIYVLYICIYVYMYICICVYMYMCIYVYVYICICICYICICICYICIYTYITYTNTYITYTNTYIHIYIHIYIYIYVYVYVYMYICICVYVYICIYVYMYICIYVYMYICIYVYMYICIYVYMLRPRTKWVWKLDGHFPRHHKLFKIINRNNVKVIPNKASHISSHNIKVLEESRSTGSHVPRTCNCPQPDECPLDGNCLASAIVYQADIKIEAYELQY